MKSTTITSTAGWRSWWAAENVRAGSDWQGVIATHLAIVDRLRSSSSWRSS